MYVFMYVLTCLLNKAVNFGVYGIQYRPRSYNRSFLYTCSTISYNADVYHV